MKHWLVKMGALIGMALSLTGCGYNDFQRLDEGTSRPGARWSTSTNAAPT